MTITESLDFKNVFQKTIFLQFLAQINFAALTNEISCYGDTENQTFPPEYVNVLLEFSTKRLIKFFISALESDEFNDYLSSFAMLDNIFELPNQAFIEANATLSFARRYIVGCIIAYLNEALNYECTLSCIISGIIPKANEENELNQQRLLAHLYDVVSEQVNVNSIREELLMRPPFFDQKTHFKIPPSSIKDDISNLLFQALRSVGVFDKVS